MIFMEMPAFIFKTHFGEVIFWWRWPYYG